MDSGLGDGGGVPVGEGGPHGALPGFEIDDGVVEAGDLHFAEFVVQGRDETRDHRCRIRHGTAVDARVKIEGGAVDFEFETGDAAEAVGHRRDAGTDHAGVGDGADVALERVFVHFEEGGEVGRADFLFAFEEEDDVHGEFAVGLESLFDAEDMGEMLAFVVRCAAAVDLVSDEGRFKRRGAPLRDRIDGLDVVVTVDEDGGTPRFDLAAGDDDGMPGRLVQFRLQPHAVEFFDKVSGAFSHVFPMTAVGGDTRETEELEKFGELGSHAGKKGFRR